MGPLAWIVALFWSASQADCHREIAPNVFEYVGDRQCVSFRSPEQITGIWHAAFEGSRFFPGAETMDDIDFETFYDFDQQDIWLTIDDETVLPENFPVLRLLPDAFYRVKFVGRFAKQMNLPTAEGYGHMGMSNGLVIVDRLESIKALSTAQPSYPED